MVWAQTSMVPKIKSSYWKDTKDYTFFDDGHDGESNDSDKNDHVGNESSTKENVDTEVNFNGCSDNWEANLFVTIFQFMECLVFDLYLQSALKDTCGRVIFSVKLLINDLQVN